MSFSNSLGYSGGSYDGSATFGHPNRPSLSRTCADQPMLEQVGTQLAEQKVQIAKLHKKFVAAQE